MKTFSKATNRLIPATLFELQSCWNIFPRKTKPGLDRRSPQSWPRICLERQVVLGRSSDSWPLWPFQCVSSPGEEGWSWNCWCSWSVLRFLSHLLRNHLTNTAPIWAWACKFWRVLEKMYSKYFFLPREAWSASERSVWERCKGDGACTDYYSGGALAQAQHKTANDREVVTSKRI